ncbi:hypothetical protein BLOT_003574, partial [Blomia tropicalis]
FTIKSKLMADNNGSEVTFLNRSSPKWVKGQVPGPALVFRPRGQFAYGELVAMFLDGSNQFDNSRLEQQQQSSSSTLIELVYGGRTNERTFNEEGEIITPHSNGEVGKIIILKFI